MNILVIYAQGGGLGKQLIAALRKNFPDMDITAVGTNTMATAVMLKAGATHAATGENAVVVSSRKADIVIGPLAIVIADSMFGEITPAMSLAIAQSSAKRILIPFNHCDNIVVGIGDYNMTALIQEAVDEVARTIKNSPPR